MSNKKSSKESKEIVVMDSRLLASSYWQPVLQNAAQSLHEEKLIEQAGQYTKDIGIGLEELVNRTEFKVKDGQLSMINFPDYDLKQMSHYLHWLRDLGQRNALLAGLYGIVTHQVYVVKRSMIVKALQLELDEKYSGVLWSPVHASGTVEWLSRSLWWKFDKSDNIWNLVEDVGFAPAKIIRKNPYHIDSNRPFRKFFSSICFSNKFFAEEDAEEEKLIKCYQIINGKYEEVIQFVRNKFAEKLFTKKELKLAIAEKFNGLSRLSSVKDYNRTAEATFAQGLDYEGFIQKTKQYAPPLKEGGRWSALYRLNIKRFDQEANP